MARRLDRQHTPSPTNSKLSRVQPDFSWIREFAGVDAGRVLIKLADGLAALPDPGEVVFHGFSLDPEVKVPASPARLAWMLRNGNRLVPKNERNWGELKTRFEAHDLEKVLQKLDEGTRVAIPSDLTLEGATSCDCLIETSEMIIWIEGKRFDWLSPSIKWDLARDQLSRNLEAAWILAQDRRKPEFCVILCHEHRLKLHEEQLITGYRSGNRKGGWPHLTEGQRSQFTGRIGTLKWSTLAMHWPELRGLPQLHDLEPHASSSGENP